MRMQDGYTPVIPNINPCYLDEWSTNKWTTNCCYDVCSSCGIYLEDWYNYCPSCGKKLEACPNCGKRG